MDSPFNIEDHREAIDEHKSQRMADPWKHAAFMRQTQESCLLYWVEQIGDAELYEQRWHELGADDE